eukprot:m.12155 g.12155  ORF g.12155 m.12155 type:complete len:323 (-) comp5807_c0_seq1:589-1557(-)
MNRQFCPAHITLDHVWYWFTQSLGTMNCTPHSATYSYTNPHTCRAAGVVMWEVATYGAQPYPEYKNKEMRRILGQGERLPQPLQTGCSDEFYRFMCSCWVEDVQTRPKFKQLLLKLSELLRQERERFPDVAIRDVGLLASGGRKKKLPTQRELPSDNYMAVGSYGDQGDMQGLADGTSYLQIGDQRGGSMRRTSQYNTVQRPNGEYLSVAAKPGDTYLAVGTDADGAGQDNYLGIGDGIGGGQQEAYMDVVDQDEDELGAYMDVRYSEPLRTVHGGDGEGPEDSYFEVGGAFSSDGIMRSNPLYMAGTSMDDGDGETYMQVN